MTQSMRNHAGRTSLVTGLLFSLLWAVPQMAQAQTMTAGAARGGEPPSATQQERFQYIFFWRQDDANTRGMLQVFQSAMQSMAPTVTSTIVNIGDPRQRQIVDHYKISRAPMPLVLSIAPNNAVTKAWPAPFTAGNLREGIVSRNAASCLKALQDKKLVVICVLNSSSPVSQAVYQNASQFQADPRFVGVTELVTIDSADASETAFLRQLQVASGTTDAVTIVLAPPGEQVAKFNGPVTKEQLVSKVTAAQSACCPGGKCGPDGKCGPGGCCPGGKCGPQKGK